jgi:hypothetical protein
MTGGFTAGGVTAGFGIVGSVTCAVHTLTEHASPVVSDTIWSHDDPQCPRGLVIFMDLSLFPFAILRNRRHLIARPSVCHLQM